MNGFPGSNLLFLVRTAWRYAEGHRVRMVQFYGLLLVANIVLCFQPLILAHLVDTAQRGGDDALLHVIALSVLYAGVSLIFWLMHGPARIIERRVAFHVSRRFVATLYRMVTELPLRWHQDHHSGSTINRIRRAEKALFTFAQDQFVIIQIIVRFVASSLMLAVYSVWVAMVSFALSLLIALVIRRFDRDLVPNVRRTNEAEHSLSGVLYDYIGNIITVLTLRMQGNTSAEIDARYEKIKHSFWTEIETNEWKWASINLLLIMTQAGIVGGYIGVELAQGHTVALGAAIAIFQYLLTIMQQFYSGSVAFGQTLYQTIDVHGVDNLIADHARLVTTKTDAWGQAWKEICISDLVFTHDEGKDAFHHLRHVSLTLKAGQKVAFVGSSGSGKTTLLTLLRGLYDAQSVSLKIDGIEFDTLAPLASFTTLIPQDSEIFENTVAYNLTLGTHVPYKDLQKVIFMASFDDVLPKLTQGLETDIRERGVNLSGGQKQRLALARGLLAAKDSSLLLLDEPTSSVDQLTESAIFDRIFHVYADKTIVASVHRLHLLPRFDHIILMRDGVIVEQGDFGMLLGRQGEFARMWLAHLSQVELGTEDK